MDVIQVSIPVQAIITKYMTGDINKNYRLHGLCPEKILRLSDMRIMTSSESKIHLSQFTVWNKLY